jgi:RimK family alpha-L-glutamate ligase
MKVGLFLVAPEFKEGYRIEGEIKALGHDLTIVNVGKSSFVVDRGSIVFIAEAAKNLNPTEFKKQIIKPTEFDVIITTRMLRFIKECNVFLSDARKKGVKVFDNNLIEHSYVINKIVDEIKLGVGGINTPKTLHSRYFEDLPVLAEKIGYPLIFKNTNKGKGVGVEKHDSKDSLQKAIDKQVEAGKKAKGFLIQEYIPYEHDLRVLVIGNKTYTMKRIPPKDDFRANFSRGGSVEPFDLSVKTKDLATKAARVIGLDIAGVDVLITKEGEDFILEVNHTPGFVGMEEALGENIGKKWVQFALDSAK